MNDELIEKVSSFGERLKISGAEMGRKMTAGMSSMSFKMKEFFHGSSQVDKIVEEATSENMDGPDWAANLEICDMMNTENVNSVEFIHGIKKRIMLKNPNVQFLALVLLEACVNNCDKAFSEVAAERVLDEIVKLIDDPLTVVNNRNKALTMIEAWGESGNELKYLPVYEETYKSLRSRGIRFPGHHDRSSVPTFTPPHLFMEEESIVSASLPVQNYYVPPLLSFTPEQIKDSFDIARNSTELLSIVLTSSPEQEVLKDDLASALALQCQQSQYTIQRIIDTVGDNESMLFEALAINDELQQALSKYEDLKKPSVVHSEPEPAMIPVAVEPEESPRVSLEEGLVRRTAEFQARPGEYDDMFNDLDEMIFGRRAGSATEDHDSRRKYKKDDPISF